jgi:3-oxoacyl-[acyl-carrier protein] reductase
VDLGLANATAVVVGGSRGMGLAAARRLAEDGARVALVGRTRASLDSAVAELTDRGSPDAVGFAADIGDAADVDKVFAEIAARWNGELNVLINTVGPGAPAHMPRAGLPEEIGPVVAFLASRRNS